MFKKVDLNKVMKMEVEMTSDNMSENAIDIYTIGWKRIHQQRFFGQLKILLYELWEEFVKDQEPRYNSYQTESHLIFINNDGVKYFIKFR